MPQRLPPGLLLPLLLMVAYLLALTVIAWGFNPFKHLTSVERYGNVVIGEYSALLHEGGNTMYPYKTVPHANFYVYVLEKDMLTWCIYDDCGDEGAHVEDLGGWISASGNDDPDAPDTAGMDEKDFYSGRHSLIVISNQDGIVVGIYPDARMVDLPAVLERHKNLWGKPASHPIPRGVSRYGNVVMGEKSPLQKLDPLMDPFKTGLHYNFYVFVVQKDLPTMCTNEGCGIDGARMEPLGGWLSGDADAKTILAAGMNVKEVKGGQHSLIVVTDKEGIVVGIYPDAWMTDLRVILERHKNLWGKPVSHPPQLSGVSRYGSVVMGKKSPLQEGDPMLPPYKSVPHSSFYVFVVERNLPTKCVYEECGDGGARVRDLGGWISGDDQVKTILSAGMNVREVISGQHSLIVVSDKKGIVVGIYPDARKADLPAVLEKHRNLWSKPLSQSPLITH